MKKLWVSIACFILSSALLFPAAVFAREGDCGYEGGISSGEAPGKNIFDYQEVTFITGEPIVLKGTVKISKSLKGENVTVLYNYSLKNTDKAATLTRTLTYSTKLTAKENGQTIEETILPKTPMEVLKVGDVSCILRSYDFSRSSVIDNKPAINYYAGNTWGKKVYQAGTAGQVKTVTVTETGDFYGYDQYWGTTEVQTINYVIQSDSGSGDTADSWGGAADVALSSSTTKQLKYIESQPDQISFQGGYIQQQSNSSILEYSSTLPEFDSKGVSTDNLVTKSGSLKLETFPVQTRLMIPELSHLRGHWAESNIKELFSLEIFSRNPKSFIPEQYISRAEFTDAFVKAAKAVPKDPQLLSKTAAAKTSARASRNVQITSPFSDVSTGSIYFSSIKDAFDRGLVSGSEQNMFTPEGRISKADALVLFVKALGLEAMAPNSSPVTTFRDDRQIPGYARTAAYVAQEIGVAVGDERGNLKPDEYLTKAMAASMLNRFVNYMRDSIRADYRERIVNFR